MHFSKYTGCGNDFILIDNRSLFFPTQETASIQHLCNRRHGIGADGIILLEASNKADYRMRIFNNDGSEAEMCGNGIRCLMLFIAKLCPGITCCTVETTERLIPLSLQQNGVMAAVGDPTAVRWHLPIDLQKNELSAHFLNTGVPHCVIFVDDIDRVDIASRGPILRRHPLFGVNGTNVNFVTCTGQECYYRTWERGVEDETPACGTGAIAVALACAYQHHLPSPITIWTRSKQALHLSLIHI